MNKLFIVILFLPLICCFGMEEPTKIQTPLFQKMGELMPAETLFFLNIPEFSKNYSRFLESENYSLYKKGKLYNQAHRLRHIMKLLDQIGSYEKNCQLDFSREFLTSFFQDSFGFAVMDFSNFHFVFCTQGKTLKQTEEFFTNHNIKTTQEKDILSLESKGETIYFHEAESILWITNHPEFFSMIGKQTLSENSLFRNSLLKSKEKSQINVYLNHSLLAKDSYFIRYWTISPIKNADHQVLSYTFDKDYSEISYTQGNFSDLPQPLGNLPEKNPWLFYHQESGNFSSLDYYQSMGFSIIPNNLPKISFGNKKTTILSESLSPIVVYSSPETESMNFINSLRDYLEKQFVPLFIPNAKPLVSYKPVDFSGEKGYSLHSVFSEALSLPVVLKKDYLCCSLKNNEMKWFLEMDKSFSEKKIQTQNILSFTEINLKKFRNAYDKIQKKMNQHFEYLDKNSKDILLEIIPEIFQYGNKNHYERKVELLTPTLIKSSTQVK